ncbi:MAG: hypothetical protein Kow0062_09810 [Acidobacteriota bacterium]
MMADSLKSPLVPAAGSGWDRLAADYLTSDSRRMCEVLEQVRSVADTSTTVLFTGETGVGKGVFARLVHSLSPRRDRPFVSAHCGAIPDTLLESELFGHEKGAFTGASRRRAGKFEQAAGGTLFLDEIGTISPLAQVKLLQVLQDRTYFRVGGEDALVADVRVIAATNSDLRAMAESGEFRKDLYYRLSVFPIEIPPLRDRCEDIPRLVRYFLARLRETYPKQIDGVDPVVMDAFRRYSWPGNIRELENILERAYIIETSSILRPESFPAELFTQSERVTPIPMDTLKPLSKARRDAIDYFERAYLARLLTRTGGRLAPAAELAGVTPRQLRNLLSRHGLERQAFQEGGAPGRRDSSAH